MAATPTKNTRPRDIQPVQKGVSLLTEHDIYLFKQGRHFRLYDKLGAHIHAADGIAGVHFAVWAPNARRVAVIGDFNGWRAEAHPLFPRQDDSGIWEGFIPGVSRGARYKYHLTSHHGNYQVEKTDPFARHTEDRAAHGLGRVGSGLPLGRSGVDAGAGPGQCAECAPVHLRGPSRIVAARPEGG